MTADTIIELEVSNGIPLPVEVRVNFTLPATAAGTFHITMYEDGIPTYLGQSFNVAYASGYTSVVVKGNGTRDFVAVLTNDATGATDTIGKYTVDFDKKDYTTTLSAADIEKAFENVGGLSVVASSTVPGVTTAGTSGTTSTTSAKVTTKASTTTSAITTTHTTTKATTTPTTTTKASTTATTTTAAPPRVEPEQPENPQ